jgi:opacity protein-like surface antigen
MNKTLLIAIAIVFACVFSAGAQTNTELRIQGIYTSPSDDWDNSYGGEAQYIYWDTMAWGIGFSIGTAKWDVSEDFLSLRSVSGIGGMEGDVSMLPMGVSILYRTPVNEKIAITFEGGAKYVLLSSNIKANAVVTNGQNTIPVGGELDMDNAFTGILGADVDYDITQDVSLFAGAGYQFDIQKGTVNWTGAELGDAELKGTVVKGGISFKF